MVQDWYTTHYKVTISKVRHHSVRNFMLGKLTGSQLSLPHEIILIINEKIN